MTAKQTEFYARTLTALGIHPDDVNKVRRRIDVLEKRNHAKAEYQCNVPTDERWYDRWETQRDKDLAEIVRLMPVLDGLLFINQDPRGYAIKVNNKKSFARNLIHDTGMARDWGGYGLLQYKAYK